MTRSRRPGPFASTPPDPARVSPARATFAAALAVASLLLAGPPAHAGGVDATAATSPAAAASAATPDPAALLATWKDATGGAAWDAIAALATSGTLSVAGLQGPIEGLEDLRTGRYVARFDLKVVEGVQGFDGEHPWELTPTGEVLVQSAQGEVEAAVTEAWMTARGAWYPERRPAAIRYDREEAGEGGRWHVLVARPEGGREVELWLDAATGLLARRVEQGGTRTTTTTYSDWREVPPGIRLPFRTHSTSGDAASEVTIELASAAAVAAPEAAAFAPPQVAVDDFAIAGGKPSTVVPFELLNNHVYVMGRVDGGEPRRFLVDTGGVNLLIASAADELGVVAEGAVSVGGVGEGREEAGFARLRSFTFGEVTLHEPLFMVVPFANLQEVEGVPFAGLVGYEVFQRFAVTFDYARGELTLTRPEAFTPPPGAVAVPFQFADRHPVVEGKVDGIPGTFSIDTGSRSSLDLHAPFVAEHGLADRYAAGPETITGWGVGGPSRSRVSRAAALELGGVRVEDPIVELSNQKGGAFTDRYRAGNLGTGVLKRFTVAFDYSRNTIWLAPNGTAGDPYDRAGVWLNAEALDAAGGAAAFRVEAVVPGGPAAAAGLVAGDRVVAVDGVPTLQLRLPDVRRRLRESAPGTVVTFRVEGAGGAARDVAVTLREMV